MLKNDDIPDYLKVAKLMLISKNGKTTASLKDIRPIAILSHITKVLEKAMKNKLEATGSKLLHHGSY
jgi:hypothetical protein